MFSDPSETSRFGSGRSGFSGGLGPCSVLGTASPLPCQCERTHINQFVKISTYCLFANLIQVCKIFSHLTSQFLNASQMSDTEFNPGPINKRVLTRQAEHRSTWIWDGPDDGKVCILLDMT